MTPQWFSFAIALLGACVGATGAILAQVLNNRLAYSRELERFKIISFERFRREFRESQELHRISLKDEDLTDEEIDEYVGFFEEIGIYWTRNLIDIELVDEILGDYILECYDDDHIMRSIGAVRGSNRDDTYYKYFQLLAAHLKKLKEARLK